MSWQGFLKHRADVLRLEQSVAMDGTVSENWVAHLQGAACLLEKDIDQDDGVSVMRCYFSDGTDLRPDSGNVVADRVEVEGMVCAVRRVTRFNGMRLQLMVAELEQVID